MEHLDKLSWGWSYSQLLSSWLKTKAAGTLSTKWSLVFRLLQLKWLLTSIYMGAEAESKRREERKK